MLNPSPDYVELDDIYKVVAYIYHEKNERRERESTFSHLSEASGFLAAQCSKPNPDLISITSSLCRTLGWYFPLLAKARIRSAEGLIFRKFPSVCPYCMKVPHDPTTCKLNPNEKVNYNELRHFYDKNWITKPHGLDAWQAMFQMIYPRQPNVNSSSPARLFQELGELAEAVRVIDVYPNYFLSEAADVFTYLMGIANELSGHIVVSNPDAPPFSLEHEFVRRFPGACSQCNSSICICPHLPEATIGRSAKELRIANGENLFTSSTELYSEGAHKQRIIRETLIRKYQHL